MNSGGIAVALVGVLILFQVFGGQALDRLRIVS